MKIFLLLCGKVNAIVLSPHALPSNESHPSKNGKVVVLQALGLRHFSYTEHGEKALLFSFF